MNLKGNNDEYAFAGTHEYTLVYAKDKEKSVFYEFPVDEDELLKDWEQDEIGLYKQGANLKSTGVNAPREKRPNLFFPVFIDNDNNVYVTHDDEEPLNYVGDLVKIYPITDNQEMSWRWSKKKFMSNNHDLIVSRQGNNVSLYKKQRPELNELPTKKPKTIFYKPEYSSGNGTAQIKELFGEKVFSNPKPLELIKDFITLTTTDGDIILDYHAGSGTTAHAVLDLNKNGGSRKFILIEQMDYIEDITVQRIIKAMKKYDLNESFVCFELKKYNQYFIDKILVANTMGELDTVYNEMAKNAFFKFWFDKDDFQKQYKKDADDKQISLDDRKKILIEVLDENQLYLNYADMDDTRFNVSDDDKALSKAFYGA